MKIERKYVEESTIQDFADKYHLTMTVRERDSFFPNCRYFASFDHVEVNNKNTLVGEYGDGGTEEEAIAHYAKRISEKPLVIDAYGVYGGRKEVKAPRFSPYSPTHGATPVATHSNGGTLK